MKKIYYDEQVPQDKSAMALERCNTMDIKDGSQEEECLIERTTSASSLDHLKEASTASRVTSREVSKSLSEDSLFKGQSGEAKAFTEDDLSSSWLYKTMQASINARFKSPRKSPSLITTGYLEPVAIKDPKLKPIPVKSRASRTSSCLCNFATLVGVSLCVVGFLASIAAIIYMEVFAGRNLTSLHTSEAQVDLSDVVLNSLETYKLTTHGLNSDDHKITEKSAGETSIKDAHFSLANAPRPTAERIIGAENPPDLMRLNQYVSTTETKIKFQDKDTVILEIKPRDSTDTAKSSNENFGDRYFKGNLNETEQTSFKDQSSKSIVKNEWAKRDKVSADSVFNTIKDTSVTEGKMDSDSNFLFDKNELKGLIKLENQFKYEGSMKINDPETSDSFFKRTFEKVTNPIKQLDKYETFNSKEKFEKVSNPAANDLFQADKKMESSNQVKDGSNGIKLVSNDLSDLSEQQFLGNQPEDENSSPVRNLYNSVKTEHDVDSMVMTVDEPEESTDLFIPNNNEENTPFEFSSFRPSIRPQSVQTEGERNVLANRPVDIKVSLAEAMKRLQVLDTQNKLLTSRTKLKPKVKTSKKQKNVSWKNEDTLEKQRYLQKVRFMLYNQLQ